MRGAFGAVENVKKYSYGERMGLGKGASIARITDGTSNSVMFSEVLANHKQDGRTSSTSPGGLNRDIRGVMLCPMMGGNSFSGAFPPNSKGTDVSQGLPLSGDPAAFPPGHKMYGVQDRNTDPVSGGQWQVAARSQHSGGVVAAYCDGSVRFITSNIDPFTWTSLCTIGGGEPVSTP